MRSALSKAKLTLWISNDVKQFGKAISKSYHASLSQLVSDYLSRLREAEESPSKMTPIVGRLSGVIPGKRIHKEEYQKHLEKKYLNA